MSKASNKALEALHSALATALKEAIVGKDGADEAPEPSAPILSVARQFLKDNGIESLPGDGTPMADLIGALPDFDDDTAEGDLPQLN